MPTAVDNVFAALADPTRRNLLNQLADSEGASASTLAQTAEISRQAIAKHFEVLEQAGLVSRRRVGKEVRFYVEPQQLAATGRYLTRFAERWSKSATVESAGSVASVDVAERTEPTGTSALPHRGAA